VTDQTVTFAPGETTKTVFVTLCGDMIREPTEKFNLILSGQNVGNPDIAVMNIHDTANRFRERAGICVTPGSVGVPYPSTMTISGAPTEIGSIRVTLYGLVDVVPADLDVLLVGPGGQNFVLMSGAGGSTTLTDPATLTFSDDAGQILTSTTSAVSGEYEPTSFGSVSNFPAPAPTGPYNEPGSVVGGTGTQTLRGVYGQTNANGQWSLYVRNNGTGSGCIVGGWGLEFLSPTAGNVSISGQVTTSDGRGITNARLVLTGDSLGEPLIVRTRAFGYYSFDNLRSGETFVVTVNSRQFTFNTPSQVVSPVGNLTDVNFVAEPRH